MQCEAVHMHKYIFKVIFEKETWVLWACATKKSHEFVLSCYFSLPLGGEMSNERNVSLYCNGTMTINSM